MDDRLREKLALLGEPTLPESLRAGELFRRMDSGELVLPEGPENEAVPSGTVIPWAKVLRRGIPIAACLALVVLLSQSGLWKMGASGGAGVSAAAPRMEGSGDQSAPAERYSLDESNNAAPQEPDPGPGAITADDAVGDAKDASADDVEDENAGEISEETADDEDEPEAGRPDSGGDLRPDIWVGRIGEDDADTIKSIWNAFNEVLPELAQQDETLAGMIPFGGLAKLQYDTYDDVTAYFPFGYELYKIVTYRAIRCSIARGEDGEFHVVELFSFEEWEPE